MKKNVVGFPQLETTNVGSSQFKTIKKTKQVLFKVLLLVVAMMFAYAGSRAQVRNEVGSINESVSGLADVKILENGIGFYAKESTREIYKTTDKGKTWNKIVIPLVNSNNALFNMGFFMFSVYNERELFVFDENNINITMEARQNTSPGSQCVSFFSTNDGGNTWQESNILKKASKNIGHFLDKNNGVVITDSMGQYMSVPTHEQIYLTNDRGQTWQRIFGISNFEILDIQQIKSDFIYFSGRERAWVSSNWVYGKPKIYKIENGITKEINSPNYTSTTTIPTFQEVEFYNENIGFVSIDDELFRTEDGGNNWIKSNIILNRNNIFTY